VSTPLPLTTFARRVGLDPELLRRAVGRGFPLVTVAGRETVDETAGRAWLAARGVRFGGPPGTVLTRN
jgi:hypothetical protein